VQAALPSPARQRSWRSHRRTRRDRLRHDHHKGRSRRTLLGEETLNAFR
jgi:hypothetical protein